MEKRRLAAQQAALALQNRAVKEAQAQQAQVIFERQAWLGCTCLPCSTTQQPGYHSWHARFRSMGARWPAMHMWGQLCKGSWVTLHEVGSVTGQTHRSVQCKA